MRRLLPPLAAALALLALAAAAEVRVPITRRGKWYVKFIRMEPVRDSVDYESKWASLTFQVR